MTRYKVEKINIGGETKFRAMQDTGFLNTFVLVPGNFEYYDTRDEAQSVCAQEAVANNAAAEEDIEARQEELRKLLASS